jgi:hypothetical protein
MKSYYTAAWLCFPEKLYTLAGFEPVSSVPQAGAMTTAPRLQGIHVFSSKMEKYCFSTQTYLGNVV